MKYIRTKDGRIAKYFPPIYPTCDNRIGYPSSKGLIFEEEILNQADTIEELCDEFALHYGDTMRESIPIPWATYERRGDNWQKHKEKLISELKKSERKAIVYGAIWTGIGLIYVAKMNDKGELELL